MLTDLAGVLLSIVLWCPGATLAGRQALDYLRARFSVYGQRNAA